MAISFEAIGQKMVTFAAGTGLAEGKVCKISANGTVGPCSEDGVFGTETQNALIAFQNRNGLTADGTAGASTLKKLSGSCKAATATAAPSSNGTLHEGDSGEESLTGAAPMLLQGQTWYVTGDTIELKVISRTSELMD